MITCTTRSVRGMLALTAAAIFAATLGGCATVKTEPTTHVATPISGSEARQTTWVSNGETLTVKLPTHGGASYTWRLAPGAAKNGLCSYQGRREQVNEAGHMARSGEQAWDVFTFKAKSKGQATIEFIYDYAWSHDTSKSKRLMLDVSVVKPGETPALATGSGEF